jgi:hypothetical protein
LGRVQKPKARAQGFGGGASDVGDVAVCWARQTIGQWQEGGQRSCRQSEAFAQPCKWNGSQRCILESGVSRGSCSPNRIPSSRLSSVLLCSLGWHSTPLTVRPGKRCCTAMRYNTPRPLFCHSKNSPPLTRFTNDNHGTQQSLGDTEPEMGWRERAQIRAIERDIDTPPPKATPLATRRGGAGPKRGTRKRPYSTSATLDQPVVFEHPANPRVQRLRRTNRSSPDGVLQNQTPPTTRAVSRRACRSV